MSDKKMKKLLILGIYLEPVERRFPPYVSVGAVLSLSKYGLRPYNWYNENGITPFIFA
jgi:hypothetical protein